jgi:hypothetical protein
MRTWARQIAFGLVLVLWASPSSAYYLDKDRNFNVRVRAYSQLAIMTQDSGEGWPTGKGAYSAGDLASHRNFYNPEFDAKLGDYTHWMNDTPGLSLISPDEFKFRFAWWGFYDGLYDYLDGPWNTNRQNLKAREAQSDHPNRESFTFTDENKNPRHIYGSRNRINELYLDYTKGRVFIRAGRQAISWGESDDIALLDVSNPFDLTMGLPGVFQDLEEARIPLWTLRSTIKVLDSWHVLSSVFADMYLVPGIIDTTVPINPVVGGVSPYTPDQTDPQSSLPASAALLPGYVHVSLVDKLPPNTWSNSRWGARLEGVVARDYTVQGWFIRTFPEQPTPHITGAPGGIALGPGPLGNGTIKATQIDDRGFRVPICLGPDGNPVKRLTIGRTPGGRACSLAVPVVTVLDRRLESVIGVAASWFSQPLNGIIRTEAEYFLQEQAFIPGLNLNPQAQVPGKTVINRTPITDYLRWVIGYDRFFFFRPLNPSNSFTLSTAWHGTWNIFERREKDFRNASTKPSGPQSAKGQTAGPATSPIAPAGNFEDAKKFDNNFLQIALQSDYLHGRLQPRLVTILDVSGIFVFAPTATFRLTDNVLLSGTYIAIEGSRKSGLGLFRNHDQAQIRVTFQLN